MSKLHSSVGSIQDFKTGGGWSDPPVQPIFLRSIDDSHSNRIHSFLTALHSSMMVMWENSYWLGKNIVCSAGYENSRKA